MSLNVGAAFLKRNRSGHPDQLRCEARGLQALAEAAAGSGIDVPAVLAVDDDELATTRVAVAAPSTAAWQRLGAGLAALHARALPRFGWGEDNYIGANAQRNGWCGRWGEFFIARRLDVQVGLVRDPVHQRACAARLAAGAARLREYLDAACTVPALVHGDLWRGNVLFDEAGRVWLIDPAVYAADPEVDLAMTELFGGFAPRFYAAYRERRPAPADYAVRRRIYNLYHSLNHYNLFGPAYLDGCEDGWAAIEGL